MTLSPRTKLCLVFALVIAPTYVGIALIVIGKLENITWMWIAGIPFVLSVWIRKPIWRWLLRWYGRRHPG